MYYIPVHELHACGLVKIVHSWSVEIIQTNHPKHYGIIYYFSDTV